MTIVFKLSDNLKDAVIKHYERYMPTKTPPYAVFQVKNYDTTITLYESGKIMFQGLSADIESSIWIEQERIKNNRYIDISGKEKESKKEPNKKFYNISTIGSDEVGTGDYFGPIVVTASFVKKEDIPFLKELGVTDSKKLTDEKITKIVPEIIKKIKYKSIILNNEEYNEKYSKENNMNKIKAIMHNKVLYSLLEETGKVDCIIIDEFAKEERYYKYLEGINNIVRNITFITKAEDKNYAVACSSVISRYIFIKEFNKLSDTYHIPLPKGSGSNVDKTGEELVEKYGNDILNKIAKKNFSNTKRILKTMIF